MSASLGSSGFESSRLSLFGTRRQTVVLLLLALLEESYPRELSRLTGVSLPAVQRLIEKLEIQGVLATRLIGKERRVSLNPRFFGMKQLRDLLLRLAEAEPEIQNIASSVRRRPRRKGKAL
jgi:DNA-binding transcriptional ArsR family regulator